MSQSQSNIQLDPICSIAEDEKHCFHTGSGMDSSGISQNAEGKQTYTSTTHYMCCFCGQTKTETIETSWDGIELKPHGNHKWINFNQPVSPFFTLPLKFDSANTIPITIINNSPSEICLIEEFFKAEQQKNPNLRSSSCLISCPCSKHRVIC